MAANRLTFWDHYLAILTAYRTGAMKYECWSVTKPIAGCPSGGQNGDRSSSVLRYGWSAVQPTVQNVSALPQFCPDRASVRPFFALTIASIVRRLDLRSPVIVLALFLRRVARLVSSSLRTPSRGGLSAATFGQFSSDSM